MSEGLLSPGQSFSRIVTGIGRAVESGPWWAFALSVLALGIVRTGPLPIGPEWVQWLRSAAQKLPAPGEYLSSSVGPAGLMRFMGAPQDAVWWATGLALWVAVFGVAIAVLSRRGPLGRLTAIAVAASPAFAVTLTMLGHYDLWMIIGTAAVALARRSWLTVLGAVIAVAGNPEQSVPSAAALLLVALAWRSRRAIVAASGFLLLALLAVGLAGSWASSSGSPSRTLAFFELTWPSLQTFIGVWPVAIYAWFGPLWILVILGVGALSGWGPRILAIMGVIVIPGLMSALTLDGTRVFVAVGVGALVSLIAHAMRVPWKAWSPTTQELGACSLGFFLLPSIIVDTGGALRLPYSDWLTFIKAH